MIKSPLHAVTFDLDDTLWSVDDVLARAEQVLYEYLRCEYPLIAERFAIADMRELRRRLAADRADLARNATKLRRAMLYHVAQDCGLDESAAEQFTELCFAIFIEARQQVKPYEEVPEAISYLAQHLSIGVITNGNADVYRTELGPFIDFVVRGVDIDIPKPEPEIFHYACRQAGLTPEHVLHVGDDPWIDAAGALSAGMQAALICRDGVPGGSATLPDCAIVPDLNALNRLIDRALGCL
ncbi:HAD family hydrolase [Halorhodospira halochloris]|uniref:HAD family hydrolase n=1 Tax=Halorhodospira halochloris TaxID=1052 RepID=UPI001EE945E4|nr:HAD family hydrolase [Halorhodospira halochloris]MCG5547963.1 HAD family hydrolase [Halorhodospira halochloris]